MKNDIIDNESVNQLNSSELFVSDVYYLERVGYDLVLMLYKTPNWIIQRKIISVYDLLSDLTLNWTSHWNKAGPMPNYKILK